MARKPIHRKVKGAGVFGVVATAVIAILDALGVSVPQGVSDAIVAVAAVLGGYSTPA